MRHILTVTKGNMRKNKGVYVSIFILMFIVSISLCSVINYYINAKSRISKSVKETGYGDMYITLGGEKLDKENVDIETLSNELKKSDMIGKVNYIEYLYGSMEYNKKSSSENNFIINEKNEVFDYKKYNENKEKITYSLKKGEVSVPIYYKSYFDCKIGDSITIQIGKIKKTFKIASYIEDPYVGSFIIGMKTLLISEDDMNELIEETKNSENKNEYSGYILNIFKAKNIKSSLVQFEKELNKTYNIGNYALFSMSKEQSQTYMMLIINILSGILIAFIVMLLFASLVVMNHNIGSSIKIEYKNFGILKSVGMTNNQLRISVSIGYIVVALVGLLCGIPASIPIVKFIGNVTLTSVGIYIPFKLNYIINLSVICAVVLIIILFVFIKTNKITEITPIEAINGGIKSIHFSSLLKLPITKKCMSISLAYRQFISEKKQYLSAIFVTMILTMFMIMMNDTCKWVNNKENIQKMFMVVEYDFRVGYKDSDVKKEAENIIKSYTDYTKYNLFASYLVLNDVQSFCNIIDDPEQYNTVYEGRTCLYDNEVLVTKYISDKYGVSVGDEVSVSINGHKEIFIISGIYECADDIGNNFAMNFDGFSKFENDEEIQNYGYNYYKLDNPEMMGSIMKKLSEKFTINKDYFIETESMGMELEFSTVSIAINSITVLIYILSMIFVFITVSIVCKKIILKEERDYGIYKSIGFTSGKIRLQLAVRFTVSALIGAVSGIVMVLLFSNKIFNAIYQTFGIYNYKSSLNCFSVIITVFFMTATFWLFAYFKSEKVRRVEPGILIEE